MKICFISRSAYPLFNQDSKEVFGGAEVDLYLISKELAKDDKYDVHFIVGDFGQLALETRENVTIHKSYRFNEKKLFQMLKLIRAIIFIKADIYIQESASGGTGVIALVCKLLRKKFIYRTASDIDCNGTYIENNFIEGKLFKFGIKNASAVITQNDNNKKQLKENLSIDSIVIRNCISVPEKNFVEKDIILWVGRSEYLKQPHLFLEIAKKIPYAKFLMICPKANFNSVDLEELSKKVKDIPNLDFINQVPYNEINKYYQRAKIFINTSLYEGFPNTFIQSSAHAVAIFSLNVNPDNFININKCGYFANGNMNELINHLEISLRNETVLNEMCANSYLFAKNNSDITINVNLYKNIISDLLKL